MSSHTTTKKISEHDPRRETNFNAQRFVKNNGYATETENQSLRTALRCIDDREHRTRGDSHDPLPPYAVPGAGFGVLMAALAGIRKYENETETGTNNILSPETIINAVETVIGKMSYHTDDNPKHKQNPTALPFAGCGHCAGNFHELSPSDRKYITESYIPKLTSAGIRPTIYEGEHNAAAVMIVDDDTYTIGLPSTDGAAQVYVYHKQHQDRIIKAISDEIAQLCGGNEAISAEITKAIKNAAKTHLENTIHHLAADLPQFIVKRTKDGGIISELA